MGTQRELSAIVKYGGSAMTKEGIEWRFNSPSSSHFNELWESAVKIAKFHLKRVMSETKFTQLELYTLLCQVSTCLSMSQF